MSKTCRRDFPDGFEEVTREGICPKTRKAVEQAFRDKRFPILLYGGAGTGKSCAMAWYYAFWNGPAKWHITGEYCEKIQRCRRYRSIVEEYDGRSYDATEHSFLRTAKDPQRLVCIDDLGLRGSSDSVYEIVLNLIDCRKGKPTIITSNLNLDGIRQVYDERIASRLSAGALIEVTGPDRRLAQGIRIRA